MGIESNDPEKKSSRPVYFLTKFSEETAMNSKTGDLPDPTCDTKIFNAASQDADPADNTLDINDPAAATVEIANPDWKRPIVGGRSVPGSAASAGGYHILRKIGEG